MIKPHIKVIQRNGVDVFVTSSMVDKEVRRSASSDDEKRRTGGGFNRYEAVLQAMPSASLMSPAGIDRARLNAQYVGMCGAYGGAFS